MVAVAGQPLAQALRLVEQTLPKKWHACQTSSYLCDLFGAIEPLRYLLTMPSSIVARDVEVERGGGTACYVGVNNQPAVD
jgi:hypothetical protein